MDLSQVALEDVIKLAGQGDSDAQFELGCRYNFGEGVENNFLEAVKWFRKSAEPMLS